MLTAAISRYDDKALQHRREVAELDRLLEKTERRLMVQRMQEAEQRALDAERKLRDEKHRYEKQISKLVNVVGAGSCVAAVIACMIGNPWPLAVIPLAIVWAAIR